MRVARKVGGHIGDIVAKYFELNLRPVIWSMNGDSKGPKEDGWPTKTYTLADYRDGDRVACAPDTR